MIQILYEDNHKTRAEALSTALPGSRAGEINATDPERIVGLNTLTFWGHGDQFKLCGHDARGIVSIISRWKRMNSGLKTVEILTCNARHASGGDPMARQIKSKFGFMTGTRGITLKALPVTVTGKMNAWSILLAETNTKSWVYVTAPGTDDKLLMKASSLITFETTPDDRCVSYRGDIATRANKMVKITVDENGNPRKWTMNYGYFNTLRATLGVVN